MPEEPNATPETIPLPLDIPTNASKNVEVIKYYTFNETGNIMISTTVGQSAEIEDSVRKVFAEVSVFFAAMTKTLSTQKISLYDYNALEKIIDRSGCFIRVTEEDIEHTTSHIGADFSKELIQGLLGLAAGADALMFANAMISNVGKEGLKLSADKTKKDAKVGNIIFVCEYLMGMPIVSAIVVYVQLDEKSTAIKISPCLQTKQTQSTLIMHKDTYMFVTPRFIHEYAEDLDAVGTDAAYGELIKNMKGWLQQN